MNLSSGGADVARLSTLAQIERCRSKQKPTVTNTGLAEKYAVTMHLLGKPTSLLATLAIKTLAGQIYRPTGRKRQPSSEYVNALGAIVGDLLIAAAHDPAWPCRRRMGANDFTSSSVGYRPAVRVIGDLTNREMVKFVLGNQAFGGKEGYVSRITPTDIFTETMVSLGINPADRLSHFSYGAPPPPSLPIRLVARHERGDRWERIKGDRLSIDASDPVVAALIKPVKTLNAFYEQQTITLDRDRLPEQYKDLSLPRTVSVFRGFNNGNTTEYGWDQGGRLYAYDGHYQMIPKVCRPAILINGQPTAEIDISACYLTLAYALLVGSLPTAGDLYSVLEIEREVAKVFVNTTLSSGKPMIKWSADHRNRYKEKTGQAMGNRYPLKTVAPAIMDAIPIIAKANEKGVSWPTLLFHESEIVLSTIYTLAFEHGICALPMHDAIRVPTKDKECAADVLRNAFFNKMGVIPRLSINI